MFAPELDYNAIDKPFNWRLAHFWGGRPVTKNASQRAVECCICVHDGSRITNMQPSSVGQRDENMKMEYVWILREIPDRLFRHHRKQEILLKIHGSGQDLNGTQLWVRFKSTQQEIKNCYSTNLPTQMRILPSDKHLFWEGTKRTSWVPMCWVCCSVVIFTYLLVFCVSLPVSRMPWCGMWTMNSLASLQHTGSLGSQWRIFWFVLFYKGTRK